MKTVLRYLMLLSLVIWLGGIIFFSIGVAPVVFAVLPTRALAGAVVNRSLGILHLGGLFSGIVFLLCSLLAWGRFRLPQLLIVLMLTLTSLSQFAVIPKMESLRRAMGTIDSVATTDVRRIEFNHLHEWSTRMEGGVLLLGLLVLGRLVRSPE